ncbi:MAG: hypothetical protein QM705_00070 [Ancrocorticia sp.]
MTNSSTESDDSEESDEPAKPAPSNPLRPAASAGICPTVVSFEAPRLTIERLDSSGKQAQGITADGDIYSWRPILPSTTLEEADDPALITAPEDDPFIELSVGPTHTVALTSEGTVYTWGDGAAGALGNNSTTSSAKAVEVEFPDFEEIDEEEEYEEYEEYEEDYYGSPEFTQVASGKSFSLALTSDGELYAWGANDSGQLGDATFTGRSTPVRAQSLIGATFEQISAGSRHAVALGSDGNAYAWGSNQLGQLGNGTNAFSAVPALVSAPEGITFTQVDAAENLSGAIGSDGAAYVWGSGTLPLAEGVEASNIPVKVQPPEGVTFKEISVAPSHILALATDGSAYAWGLNSYGTIGAGQDFGPRTLTPVKVAAPEGVKFTRVAAGDEHSLALSSDGYVYAWGKPFWLWDDLTSGYTDAKQYGVPRQEDPAQITAVKFGGTAGTDITRVLDGPWQGTYQVTSPAHAAGTVDVVIEWSLAQAKQDSITYSKAFTFDNKITLTDPKDQTAMVDERVFFGVDASVCEEQVATWEFSDDGETWEPIDEDTTSRVSGDPDREDPVGMWVRPRDTSYDGRLYRVTITNDNESVTSKAAILNVVANASADNQLPTGLIAGGAAGVAAVGGGVWWYVARRRKW